MSEAVVYPANHYTVGEAERGRVLRQIAAECEERTAELRRHGQHAEAERLRHRVAQDLHEMRERGFCRGMENYARHLAGRSVRCSQGPATTGTCRLWQPTRRRDAATARSSAAAARRGSVRLCSRRPASCPRQRASAQGCQIGQRRRRSQAAGGTCGCE